MNSFLFMHLAPRSRFPAGGTASQAIAPGMAWFDNPIRPRAGDPRMARCTCGAVGPQPEPAEQR